MLQNDIYTEELFIEKVNFFSQQCTSYWETQRSRSKRKFTYKIQGIKIIYKKNKFLIGDKDEREVILYRQIILAMG